MRNLHEIACEVQAHGLYMCEWRDLVESTYIDETKPDGLRQIFEALLLNNVEMLPKIVFSSKGYSVACISKSVSDKILIFCRPHQPIDKSKSHIKRALLTLRIATTMAKVDGFIVQEEIDSLRVMVYSLSYLSESEKYSIFIRGVYFFQQGFRKEELLESYRSYDVTVQREILEVAKTIVVSDGVIDNSEKFFLKELYKISGLSVNKLTSDLKLHAKKYGIEIHNRRREEAQTTQEIEIGDDSILDSLIEDFLEF